MSGGVAHLRFVAAEDPRPRLTPEVLERIATAVAEVTAAGDDGPAVLLLSGSRRAFALGADLGRGGGEALHEFEAFLMPAGTQNAKNPLGMI